MTIDDRGPTRDPDVLIAGGGPAGLILAIELGQLGIRAELVDKRPKPGRLPKMERCNARTMEHFRRMGIADRVRAAGMPAGIPMDVFICAGDLTRPPILRHAYPSVAALKERGRHVNDGSLPLEPYQLISQYTLEPLLRQVAEATPGLTVRFGCELTRFSQDADGVTATVRPAGERGEERERTVRASYLVGCDGAGSTVRRQLGIELRGESLLTLRQALFHCPELFARIPIGKGRHYHFADDRSSFLIVQDDTRHFSLHATADSDADMPRLFESLAGMPVAYETLYVGQWTQRLMLADRYRDRRVFLAGDAAHLVIPTGGLGMNTGAGDAVDLAWKLAGACAAGAAPGCWNPTRPSGAPPAPATSPLPGRQHRDGVPGGPPGAPRSPRTARPEPAPGPTSPRSRTASSGGATTCPASSSATGTRTRR